jgi:hypothetical protein
MLMEWIKYTFSNFSFVMLLLAIIIALIDWPIQKILKRTSGYEVFYRWIALLPLGITGVYTFLMHVFFPETAATAIGWQPSPFQYEVGMADLGFGIIAIISFNANYGFRLATTIGNLIWLWGDASGHIAQMIIHRNFSNGNAGTWFWMDVLIPLLLILCIRKMRVANSQ